MTSLIKNLEWKPSTVSWLSFVLMGLIVAGIGLSGTAHVVNYLLERLTAQGIESNQEIAYALLEHVGPVLDADPADRMEALNHAIESHKVFGFRIFVIDGKTQEIIADSEQDLSTPISIANSWLADAARLHDSGSGGPLQTGPARALGEDRHPMLLWLQAVSAHESDRWFLGIAKDQKTLTDFLGDLHWHLDAVMLLTYALITLLGYYAMRTIGRVYERRLESQVRERTRQLEAAHKEMLSKARLATIGQTASVLTHEMRNPLASIKLALSGLKGSDNLQEREHRRVELVLGEVDRLDGLLSETLDYVRPVKLSREPIVMDRLLSHVLKQQEPVIAGKGIRIRREICKDCTAIRLDEDKMHQVLLNLLKNALEASMDEGEIGVYLNRDKEVLTLEISNDGEPMTPETLERAFEPFYTTKPKGSGLGLGLVKRVVEEHGGTVELASDSQAGTRVTLHLPFSRP